MCVSSKSSLSYQSGDPDTTSYELHQLDCSSSPCLTRFEKSYRRTVHDLCSAELEGISLLVTVNGYRGVKAYNASTGAHVWSMEGEIPFSKNDLFARSITADEHGRLFVLDDRNKCIHVFSVKGKYVTTLLRKGEQGIAELREIR